MFIAGYAGVMSVTNRSRESAIRAEAGEAVVRQLDTDVAASGLRARALRPRRVTRISELRIPFGRPLRAGDVEDPTSD